MSVYVCTTTHFIIINKAKWFLQFFGEVIFILFPIRGGAIVGDEPAQPGHRVYKQTSLRSLWCTCSLPSRSTEHERLAMVKGRLVCSYLATIGGKSWARGWGVGWGCCLLYLSYIITFRKEGCFWHMHCFLKGCPIYQWSFLETSFFNTSSFLQCNSFYLFTVYSYLNYFKVGVDLVLEPWTRSSPCIWVFWSVPTVHGCDQR